MQENSKGELIKKKNQTQEPQQPKKKLVIKKVKKVIIKKPSQKGADETAETSQVNESNISQEKKPVKINEKPLNKNLQENRPSFNKNNFDNRKKTFPQQQQRPAYQQQRQPYQQQQRTPYQQQQRPPYQQQQPAGTDGHKKIFFKKQQPGQNRPFGDNRRFSTNRPVAGQPVLPLGDKDRTRKRDVKKNDTFIKDKEELQKAFNLRRNKQKDSLSSVPSQIDITDVISISDLSRKMNLKAGVIISKLMELGTMVTINDNIDASTAEIVCSEFNCKVNVVSLYDQTVIEEEKEDESDLEPRYPIVTVMGHVDHGKTKLLDAIRSTDVVAGEAGGITQHIGAYSVTLKSGKKITFIDTPGHEAFTTMRARGANITDIVILVVAADYGVMPQTEEAINHAKAAKVPIIVAINKIDKDGVNLEKIKQQLTDYDLLPEEWGGHTLYGEISALKKIGIDSLLDTILLQAEMLELKASRKIRAKGFVLESRIEPGRGVVITVIILKGILRVGDFFVAGVNYGKVRAMFNDKGEKIDEAGPSTPVEIIGIEKSPKSGDPFNVTATEKEGKIISAKRHELNRMEEAKNVKKVTIKDLLAKKPDVELQELKIIIKADVHGSVEALKDSLEKLSNKEIKIITVSSSVGAINESDVMLAVASKAVIIGFHVRPNAKAQELAEREKIEIRRYNIIYDVIEDIKASISGMIKPDLD